VVEADLLSGKLDAMTGRDSPKGHDSEGETGGQHKPIDQPFGDARKAWFEDYKEEINRRRQYRDTELKRLRKQDTAVFVCQIFATVVAFGLITIGIVLGVFVKASVGTISGLIGLATGASLIPLRARDNRIEANKAEVQREEREDRARSSIMTMIILTDDPQTRTKLMADFAARSFDLIGLDAREQPRQRPRLSRSRSRKPPSEEDIGSDQIS
jgi:hypothetical protein